VILGTFPDSETAWDVQVWTGGRIEKAVFYGKDIHRIRTLIKNRFGRDAIPIQMQAGDGMITIMDAAFEWLAPDNKDQCSHCLEWVDHDDPTVQFQRGDQIARFHAACAKELVRAGILDLGPEWCGILKGR
jgi:hypothetical protein